MRLYDIAIAALAIGAPRKWTDNVLSQYNLPEVVSVRQGVARRIPYQGILRLAIIRELHTELGIGVATAVHFASILLDSGQDAVLHTGQIRVSIDLTSLRKALDQRLALALESTPSRPRGRPPTNAFPRPAR
jgi:hypothetical protein